MIEAGSKAKDTGSVERSQIRRVGGPPLPEARPRAGGHPLGWITDRGLLSQEGVVSALDLVAVASA